MPLLPACVGRLAPPCAMGWLLLACGPSVRDGVGGAGQTDGCDDNCGPTDGADAQTDGASGAADGRDDDGGGDGGRPPADGFDPIPDVGDGTLSEDMLLATWTPRGSLYLWMFAERLGDGMQGSIGPAQFTGTTWELAGEDVWVSSYVTGNKTTLNAQKLVLPPGAHPFGTNAVSVDLNLETWIYGDELLCGFLDLDINATNEPDISALSFVAVPIDELGSDPQPALRCE